MIELGEDGMKVNKHFHQAVPVAHMNANGSFPQYDVMWRSLGGLKQASNLRRSRSSTSSSELWDGAQKLRWTPDEMMGAAAVVTKDVEL